MNKQSVQKFDLFVTGLEQRIKDNIDFFKDITIQYKSGTKTFLAKVSLDGQKLHINFNGVTEIIDIELLAARVSKLAEAYEAVNLTYQERGTVINIVGDNKNVKMTAGDSSKIDALNTRGASIKAGTISHADSSHISSRNYYIKVGQADEMLKEIGIMSSDGKIKNDMIRKYNQIDHYIELIDSMLKEMSEKYETINVLDCGCGKSYLTFVLNYYIKEVLKKSCHFIGLDNSDTVIDASRKMARNLGYHNMDFKVTDIRDYTADKDIHLVISLHACDTATDQAIALGLRNSVKAMVVVPCCHRELLSQYNYEPFAAIIKHGIFKARMADILTDGLRSLYLEAMGYKVSVVEYISPLETPKNLMIRAEKLGGVDKKALEEYGRIKKILDISPTLENIMLG